MRNDSSKQCLQNQLKPIKNNMHKEIKTCKIHFKTNFRPQEDGLNYLMAMLQNDSCKNVTGVITFRSALLAIFKYAIQYY